ncbi:MAG: hypothetical protein QM759_15830 [Terricaulis sp.]
MDAMATRGLGIAVSGAMIVAALIVALVAPERRPVTTSTPPVAAAQSSAPAQATQVTSPTKVTVRFRGRGPLARAVGAHSEQRITRELSRQRAFHGLCFDSFAPRGVVLRACDGGVLQAWPQRLRAMRAVARVDAGD